MNDNIYVKIKEYEPIRDERIKSRKIQKGDEFIPFAPICKALKQHGWKYRDVIDFFYRNDLNYISVSERINNNTLIKKLYYWQQKGLFKKADVMIEYKNLQQKLDYNKYNTDIPIDYNLMDFLVFFGKTDLDLEHDIEKKNKLKEFYKTHHHLYNSKEKLALAFTETQ